jgi:hypothetical protein
MYQLIFLSLMQKQTPTVITGNISEVGLPNGHSVSLGFKSSIAVMLESLISAYCNSSIIKALRNLV